MRARQRGAGGTHVWPLLPATPVSAGSTSVLSDLYLDSAESRVAVIWLAWNLRIDAAYGWVCDRRGRLGYVPLLIARWLT